MLREVADTVHMPGPLDARFRAFAMDTASPDAFLKRLEKDRGARMAHR